MRRGLTRREMLAGGLAAGGAAALGGLGCGEDVAPYVEPTSWDAGRVAHLLPAVTHDRLALVVSLREPCDPPPRLLVDGAPVRGRRSDARGLHHRYRVRGLAPDRAYTLALRDAAGELLCDPWPLRTFPAPGRRPERFRLLAYTCAGGPEFFTGLSFLAVEVRRRLLARGLATRPDAVLANGDHVYWDLRSRTRFGMGLSPQALWTAGLFDRDAPVLGGANEEVLTAAFGPQIAGLYGTLLRSTPILCVRDDHDYTDNDEATESLRTFPPDPFMRAVADATQRLYYPELLDVTGVPAPYVGPDGTGTSFGCLRYGDLLEGWLYDCRGHLTQPADGAIPPEEARFVPADVEAWLVARQRTSDAHHLLQVPSTPILWSAGKWGEWYPDVLGPDGVLGTDAPKPFWPAGWKAQHDRLLAAASARGDRLPLFLSGDLHATAAGRIQASGGLDLAANPVVSVLAGTVGTGAYGFPSVFRGTPPRPSRTLEAETWIEPVEENGFTVADFTADGVRLAFFRWTPDDGVAAIDALEPFRVLELPARSRRRDAGRDRVF